MVERRLQHWAQSAQAFRRSKSWGCVICRLANRKAAWCLIPVILQGFLPKKGDEPGKPGKYLTWTKLSARLNEGEWEGWIGCRRKRRSESWASATALNSFFSSPLLINWIGHSAPQESCGVRFRGDCGWTHCNEQHPKRLHVMWSRGLVYALANVQSPF